MIQNTLEFLDLLLSNLLLIRDEIREYLLGFLLVSLADAHFEVIDIGIDETRGVGTSLLNLNHFFEGCLGIGVILEVCETYP